jgi:hypothetical protein
MNSVTTIVCRVISLLPVLLVTSYLLQPVGSSLAQQPGQEWSAPILLFQEQGSIYDPTIVADISGGLHVFWRYVPEDTETVSYQTLYYTALKRDGQWGFPVDVFASTNVVAPSAAIDRNGFTHLIWQDRQNQIYYSRANVDYVMSAHKWQQPSRVAVANNYNHLLADEAGNLHLVYANSDRGEILYRRLSQEDSAWSTPVRVAPTSSRNTAANHVNMAIGEDATIHVVWTEFRQPIAWPPIGTFYTRSTDGGQSWDGVIMMAGEGYNQIGVAAGPDRNVHVVWNGMAGIHGRYHRWSSDNGSTWTETARLDTAGSAGSTGVPPMVVDSAGTLHLLVIDAGCLLYLMWQSDVWAPTTCISQWAPGASNFIEEPDLAISEGNKLHVVFWDDRERLWYMSRQADAPAIPTVPLPTIEPTPLPTEMPIPTVTPSPDYTFLTNGVENIDTEQFVLPGPGWLIVLGVAPALLLVLLTIAAYSAITSRMR